MMRQPIEVSKWVIVRETLIVPTRQSSPERSPSFSSQAATDSNQYVRIWLSGFISLAE